MPDVPAQYLFAYGSLAAGAALGHTPGREPDRRGWVTALAGHARRWGVAMDNREHVPGYKRYADPLTGAHPAVAVAFLELVRAPAPAAVNGLCLPVGEAALVRLDARERNYDRVDVSGFVADAPGRVWAYRGTTAARRRCKRARRDGRLVVHRAYAELVEAGFAALGPGELGCFRATTEAPACPTWDLVREDLPLLGSAR